MSNNKSAFNDFLVRLGEKPLEPVIADVSTDALELEIKEMEDKMGLSHEVDPKEVPYEQNN